MKKKIIFGVVGLLLIGIAIAGSLSSYDETINSIRADKSSNGIKDFDFERDVSHIEYTSQKECIIDYQTEEILSCSICYKFTYDSVVYDDCISVKPIVPLNATIEKNRDENSIRLAITDKCLRVRSSEDVGYIEDESIGKTVFN